MITKLDAPASTNKVIKYYLRNKVSTKHSNNCAPFKQLQVSENSLLTCNTIT